MPLRLSTTDVAEALAGLSPDERAELHGLLEARDRMTAEMPHDDREPIEEIVKRVNAETAAASVDSDAWYAAHDAHQRCYRAHIDRLSEKRTAHPRDGGEAWLTELSADMSEADALARADGFPPASEVVPPRIRLVALADSNCTACLPPAVREDVEYTRALSKRSTDRPLPPVPFVAPIIDVLGPYRGRMSDDEPQAEDR